MRLLTAGSLVRVQQGEPKNCPISSLVGQFLFNNNRIMEDTEIEVKKVSGKPGSDAGLYL